MTRREVLFLIDAEGSVLWSDAGTAAELPDSRVRWEAIWGRRERIEAIAHSHPDGPLGFSGTDRTTMEAIDAALGRSLQYLVVAPGGVVACRAHALETLDPEPHWAARLRAESGMEGRKA
jgi:hypothetical protein